MSLRIALVACAFVGLVVWGLIALDRAHPTRSLEEIDAEQRAMQLQAIAEDESTRTAVRLRMEGRR